MSELLLKTPSKQIIRCAHSNSLSIESLKNVCCRQKPTTIKEHMSAVLGAGTEMIEEAFIVLDRTSLPHTLQNDEAIGAFLQWKCTLWHDSNYNFYYFEYGEWNKVIYQWRPKLGYDIVNPGVNYQPKLSEIIDWIGTLCILPINNFRRLLGMVNSICLFQTDSNSTPLVGIDLRNGKSYSLPIKFWQDVYLVHNYPVTDQIAYLTTDYHQSSLKIFSLAENQLLHSWDIGNSYHFAQVHWIKENQLIIVCSQHVNLLSNPGTLMQIKLLEDCTCNVNYPYIVGYKSHEPETVFVWKVEPPNVIVVHKVPNLYKDSTFIFINNNYIISYSNMNPINHKYTFHLWYLNDHNKMEDCLSFDDVFVPQTLSKPWYMDKLSDIVRSELVDTLPIDVINIILHYEF